MNLIWFYLTTYLCNLQAAGMLPYLVAVDHERQEVILAIRGSFSAADIITDANWQPAILSELQYQGQPAVHVDDMTRSPQVRRL